MNRKETLKIFCMLLIPCCVYILCQQAGFSATISIYGAITLWAVYSWVSSSINATVVAMILPVLYLVNGVASVQTVFSPWATTVPWLCLGGLLIGQMMLKCGLAMRLAYKCMLLSGDTFIRILMGLMLSGFIIAPLIPTVLGKCTIFFILATGICVVLDIHPDSKTSAALFMTCLFAVTGPSYGFLTACAQAPAAVQLMQSASEIRITWFSYAYYNLVPAIIYTIISFAAVLIVLKPRHLAGIKNVVEQKSAELGPLSTNEKKATVILVVALLLLMTESLHNVNAAWCMMLISVVSFLPGINLLQPEDVDKVGYSLLYFLAGAMSVGAVAAEIGIAGQIAVFASELLKNGDIVFQLAASYFLGIISVMFLSPTTGLAAMSIPLTKIALNLSIDPRLITYAFFFGNDLYFMPYQYGILLLLVSFKRIQLKYITQVLAVKALLSILIVLPAMLLYWHLLGLM